MGSNVPLSTQWGQKIVRRKGDPKCPVHRNKEIILHCSDCDELICIKCSISTHNGHRQEELLDLIPQKKCILRDFINDTEKKTLVHLNKEIGSVENKLNGNETNVNDLPPQMKDQDDFDILTEGFNSVQLRGKNRDVLLQYKNELKDRHSNLENKMKMCKQVLQSGTAVQVYDETSNIPVDGTDIQPSTEVVLSEGLACGVCLQEKFLQQMLLVDSEVITNKRSRRNALYIAPPNHQF